MNSLSFDLAGAVGLHVTITENPDGTLRFDLMNSGSQIGDLRGLFFDLQDASLAGSLKVSGGQVSNYNFADDGITNLGGGVNMNGAGDFDGGVAFGTAGIGKDDISSTSFTLDSLTRDLTLEDFSMVSFGARFTSVGSEDGARTDSLKIVGVSPQFQGPIEIIS